MLDPKEVHFHTVHTCMHVHTPHTRPNTHTHTYTYQRIILLLYSYIIRLSDTCHTNFMVKDQVERKLKSV